MRHAVRALAVATLVVSTAGCSAYDRLTTSDFSRQEPGEVVAAARSAMADLSSLRATGQVRVRGNDVFVDVAMDDRGRCSGTMRTQEGRVALRRIGRHAWVKGDEAFFSRLGGSSLPAGRLSRLATSWVPADSTPFLQLCDLDSYGDGLSLPATGRRGAGSSRTDELRADDLSDVDVEEDDELLGVRAVHFSLVPGQTTWVRSDAPHHVLRVEQDGRDGGALSLSDFDLPVDVDAPPADEVLQP